MADNYSITDAFGGKDTDAYKNYKEGQKSGKWSDYNDYLSKKGGSSSSANLSDNISNIVKANQQAIQPAIQSYQSQIPETQAAYSQRREQLQAEKTPLQERYNNLLDKIKTTFTGQKNLATTTTNNELGRRGIVGSSGIADRELQQALSPILESEGQAVTDVGLSQEADLRALENSISNLTTEEQSAIRQILNAMGTMQSTAGMNSVSQGIQSTQFNQSNALQQQQLQQAMEQFSKTYGLNQSGQDLQKRIFDLISLPESKFKMANTTTNSADSGW